VGRANEELVSLSVRKAGRVAVAAKGPLVTVPLLGQSLLEYWLSHLACNGAKQVIVLSHDRPEVVASIAGDGSRWGLEVNVRPESRELTPAQALLKFEGELEKGSSQGQIIVIDHLPGLPQQPVFGGYRELFSALQEWMPRAVTSDRVGMRQIWPGVWKGTNSIVSPGVEFKGHCWVGRNVFIEPGAVIGPQAIVEDGVYVEGQAEITHSYIGPDTFVGRFAQLAGSMAWGSTLVDWRSNSVTQIPDPFLLCALRQPRLQGRAGWVARLKELYSRNKDEACVGWKHVLLRKEG
jgi:carbonic anhydrase/acetyltransferase-like protein (isoleucine patch superfamily)